MDSAQTPTDSPFKLMTQGARSIHKGIRGIGHGVLGAFSSKGHNQYTTDSSGNLISNTVGGGIQHPFGENPTPWRGNDEAKKPFGTSPPGDWRNYNFKAVAPGPVNSPFFGGRGGTGSGYGGRGGGGRGGGGSGSGGGITNNTYYGPGSSVSNQISNNTGTGTNNVNFGSGNVSSQSDFPRSSNPKSPNGRPAGPAAAGSAAAAAGSSTDPVSPASSPASGSDLQPNGSNHWLTNVKSSSASSSPLLGDSNQLALGRGAPMLESSDQQALPRDTAGRGGRSMEAFMQPTSFTPSSPTEPTRRPAGMAPSALAAIHKDLGSL